MTAPANLNTADRLIRQSLKDAGRLQTGQTPSGEVYADALSRMYDLINTWQTQGLKLWLNVLQPVTLVAGTATYTLGPAGSILALKPLRALEGWYVRTDGTQYPLNVLSWTDYQNLGNLTSQGAINSFFVDKQTANVVVKFWNVPDTAAAAGSVNLLLQRQAVSPTELDENVALPIEWYQALRWGLADELASGQPALIMERCERKANQFRSALEDWDVEDAPTKFQPNTQTGGPYASRFR